MLAHHLRCGISPRWLSLLYAQLQCHMMSCDTSNEEDSDQQYEAFCLCLGIVARHLADDVSMSILLGVGGGGGGNGSQAPGR